MEGKRGGGGGGVEVGKGQKGRMMGDRKKSTSALW